MNDSDLLPPGEVYLRLRAHAKQGLVAALLGQGVCVRGSADLLEALVDVVEGQVLGPTRLPCSTSSSGPGQIDGRADDLRLHLTRIHKVKINATLNVTVTLKVRTVTHNVKSCFPALIPTRS